MKPYASTPSLCLASHSPRRRELLERLGVPFFVQGSDPGVEEAVSALGRGHEAQKVAALRAAIKGKATEDGLTSAVEPYWGVLAVDTVVFIGDQILDKPNSVQEAKQFLKLLSGQRHGVVSALWLKTGSEVFEQQCLTWVTFDDLSEGEIESYAATSEPYDKAGGYGIQGHGGLFVAKLNGCYFNVMGLPLNAVWRLLQRAGYPHDCSTRTADG